MTSDTLITNALLDLLRAAAITNTPWALVGGQALISYGVTKQTDDADALIDRPDLTEVAHTLMETFGWVPLLWNEKSETFDDTDEVSLHQMDDKVLMDIGEERDMIPMRTPLGLHVDLLAAQHPVEDEMIELSSIRLYQGVRVPVAPLGGILLVKTKADRPKDHAAIEQTAEILSADDLKAAVAWAHKRDAATTEDLKQNMATAKGRLAPKRTQSYRRRTPGRSS